MKASSQQLINVVILHKFNVFHDLLSDCIKRVNQNFSVKINTFKNANVLLKNMEVNNIDLIFSDLSSWVNVVNSPQFGRFIPEWQKPVYNKTKVALILQDSESHLIDRVVKMDVDIIISMTDDSFELKQAIEHSFTKTKKDKYISTSVRNLFNENEKTPRREKLSKNEWEVIKLFSDGYTLIEIAEKRSRAISTIATQKANAMKKLKIQNNSELMKYICMNNL